MNKKVENRKKEKHHVQIAKKSTNSKEKNFHQK